MDLCPRKALQVTNYEVHLAQILPENTLMYFHYMCHHIDIGLGIDAYKMVNQRKKDLMLY